MQAIHSDTALDTLPAMSQGLFQHGSAFWRPRFAGEGEMLCFTPILFWLFAALKPFRTTVLGLGEGTSCFAICQAMERLHVDGTCIGIHFSGKMQPAISDVIKNHALTFYEGILDLRCVQDPADLSWPELINQDLLLLDLRHSSELPAEILENLPSQLSSGGCLVVHGLKQASQNEMVRHLRCLISKTSCVSIDMGAGLTILYNDPNILSDVVNASSRKLYQEVQTMFVRLGNSLVAERMHNTLTLMLAEEQAAGAKAQHRIERLEAETADLSAALDLRGRKANQYQALYFDCENELKKLRRLKAEVLDAQSERQKKLKALNERDALIAKLRQNCETHYRETAMLTVLLEDQRKVAIQEAEAIRQQLDELRMKADALELDNAAILSSTSWKITSPLRRIASKLRGQGYRP